MIQAIILPWLATIILTYCMQFILTTRILKDIADEECTLNTDAEKQKLPIDENAKTKIKHINLIPVVNILNIMKTSAEYLTNRETILKQLDMIGYIRKMSEWERLEYNKKPTGFNAFKMPFKTKIQIQKSIKLPTKEAEGNLWYINSENKDEYIIVYSDGIISNYSEQEQKRLIKEKIDLIKNEGFIGLLKLALGNDDIVKVMEEELNKLSEEMLDKPLQNEDDSLNEFSQKKEELKKLREELTQEEEPNKTKNYQKKNNKSK